MIQHQHISNTELKEQIQSGLILYGGNSKLRIYGTLDCTSGKRMKKENRVFFSSEQEAKQNGYRPCGHCMRKEYLNWNTLTPS